MTIGWSVFVIILVLVNVLGSLWLLQVLSTKKGTSAGGADETTGHLWDEDLVEYNNPLPRWWLWLFWITAIFMLVYLVIYPGFGHLSGTLNWTQIEQYDREVAAAEDRYGDVFAEFSDVPLGALAQNADAVRLGRNLFMNHCATCHGSDARGAKGFPNLADDAWLWGSAPETVAVSITNGRTGVMPGLGAAIGEQGVNEITAYVLSLSNQEVADTSLVPAGQQKYMQFCVACHGPTGTGNPALGAPDLTDDVWLHGSTVAIINDVIANGRANVMPAQDGLLSAPRIRTLVAYVLSLSAASGE